MPNELSRDMEYLKKAVSNDNFIEVAYDLVDRIKESENPFHFVEPILQLMEEFPDADFGQPGPLIHFVETFYRNGYEELLYQSIKRKPTVHTVWMLNRMINDPKLINKETYVALFNEAMKRVK
jgi:hypothetical protein